MKRPLTRVRPTDVSAVSLVTLRRVGGARLMELHLQACAQSSDFVLNIYAQVETLEFRKSREEIQAAPSAGSDVQGKKLLKTTTVELRARGGADRRALAGDRVRRFDTSVDFNDAGKRRVPPTRLTSGA